MAADSAWLNQRSTQMRLSTADAVLVKFSTGEFYCRVSDGYIDVDVVRFGDTTEMLSAEYATEDLSAAAGVHYVASQGSIVFQPGEYLQRLRVPLLGSTLWRPTLDFQGPHAAAAPTRRFDSPHPARATSQCV